MQRQFLLLVVVCLLTSCTSTYYIVRHAEKASPSSGTMMVTTNDPELSGEGVLRAKTLAERLKSKNIGRIFTTNTVRTKATAAAVAGYFSLTPQLYSAVDDAFIRKLKAGSGNSLVVGHSNTVDDIVNRLTGETHLSDLPDSAYSNIYLVIRKGKRFRFKPSTYEQLR